MQARTAPIDPLEPGLVLLGGLNPAYPFIPRERGDVVPRRQCLGIAAQRVPQIRRQIMHDTAGDLFVFSLGHHFRQAKPLRGMSAMGGKLTQANRQELDCFRMSS
jgi:hypothetical protein